MDPAAAVESILSNSADAVAVEYAVDAVETRVSLRAQYARVSLRLWSPLAPLAPLAVAAAAAMDYSVDAVVGQRPSLTFEVPPSQLESMLLLLRPSRRSFLFFLLAARSNRRLSRA